MTHAVVLACLSSLILSTTVAAHQRPYESRDAIAWDEPSEPSTIAASAPQPHASRDEELVSPSSSVDDAHEAKPPKRDRNRVALMAELSGMLGAFGSYRMGGITLGGPKIGFQVGRFAAGISFYPSLVYSTHWDSHRVRPSLGFGLEVSYFGVTLFVPTYFIAERYVPAAGIGYRFVLSRVVQRRSKERRRKTR